MTHCSVQWYPLSCSANKWGQSMTHSSIQWYPLCPAQPTNEASSWLIAQSNDIHSVLLSQHMKPVHDSLLSPVISTLSCSVISTPSCSANEASPWLNAQPCDISISSAQPTNEASKSITRSPVEHCSLRPAQPTSDRASLHRWPNLTSSVIRDGDNQCKFIAWAVAWCCSVFICQQSTYPVQASDCSNLPKFTEPVI